MTPLHLAFAHLNLRRNPFGELPLEERPALAVLRLEPYLTILDEAPRAALQFLADKGRGKTTHLLALRARRPGPYVHLPEDGPLPPVPTGVPLLYLDESQRLPRGARARLFSGPAALVLGTHEDHERALRRAGRPVTTVRPGASLDAETLGQIVAARIEAARRGPGPVPRVPPAALAALLERFGDDVRAMEHHLYERLQRLPEPCDVQV